MEMRNSMTTMRDKIIQTNMRTIELNEQAVDWLKEHLEHALNLSDFEGYSETSKGIMRHIISKLEDNESTSHN